MVIIGVEQQLSDNDLYEHICLENNKRLYKPSDKCDDQQKYKAILESELVSITKGSTENIPMDVGTSVTMKKPCERNSPSPFLAQFFYSYP